MNKSWLIAIGIAVAIGVAVFFVSTRRAPAQPASGQPANAESSHQAPAPPTDTESVKPPLAFPGVLPAQEIENKIAVIKTPKGEIRFELLPAEAPKATSNFVYLAKQGFYDGLSFHRVESWVVQGGDPNCTSGRGVGQCGAGGPGYRFEDEPVRLAYKAGIVAMANAGANTNGSQFFILKQDTPLDPAYTIFGRVFSGMDVVQQVARGDGIEQIEIVSE